MDRLEPRISIVKSVDNQVGAVAAAVVNEQYFERSAHTPFKNRREPRLQLRQSFAFVVDRKNDGDGRSHMIKSGSDSQDQSSCSDGERQRMDIRDARPTLLGNAAR